MRLKHEAIFLQAIGDDTDLVICDTSGRLHTNVGLMEELAKCRRSISKRLLGAPHEVLLVLDGTTGVASSHPSTCCMCQPHASALRDLANRRWFLNS